MKGLCNEICDKTYLFSMQDILVERFILGLSDLKEIRHQSKRCQDNIPYCIISQYSNWYF